MPGKVNPSVPEMVNQVCFQVFGCDTTILFAAEAGQLELNVMMPVIAWNGIHATRILRQAMHVFQERCVAGIGADAERCRELLDRSTAVATALSPYIGYAATADIAKAAVKSGSTIRALVRDRGLLEDGELDRVLSAEAMTSPGVPGWDERKRGGRKTAQTAGDGRPGGRVTGRGGAAAQPAVPSRQAGHARNARSRRVAAVGAGDGQAANRGRKRGR
jgi:hypothetical protein